MSKKNLKKSEEVDNEIPSYIKRLADLGVNLHTKKGVDEFLRVKLPVFGSAQAFLITEVKTNSPYFSAWAVKIKFPGAVFKEFFPNYKIHFVLDPAPTETYVGNRFEKLQNPQMSMLDQQDEIIDSIIEQKKKYEAEAVEFGVHTFQCRLKEYKADEATSSDTITFMLGSEFTKFLVEKGHILSQAKLVINDLNDPKYLEDEVKKFCEKDGSENQ